MNNQLKSKTRLAYIQLIFQHLSTKNDINEIFDSFDKNYKSVSIDNFHNKKKIKFEFNSNYLKKLIKFYIKYIELNNHFLEINRHINFDRKFQKWDIMNQSILIGALSEIKNTELSKLKIVLNDYLNISKLFIAQSDIGTINAVLDKLINDKSG